MLIFGHRGSGKDTHNGLSDFFLENTFPSIEHALETADGVEIDAQVLKDGTIVLNHDFFIFDGKKPVFLHEITFEQFIEFQKSKLEKYKTIKPEHFLLKHLLKRMNQKKILNIELKYPTDLELMEFQIIDERPFKHSIEEYIAPIVALTEGLDNKIFFSSFNLDVLLAVEKKTIQKRPFYWLKEQRRKENGNPKINPFIYKTADNTKKAYIPEEPTNCNYDEFINARFLENMKRICAENITGVVLDFNMLSNQNVIEIANSLGLNVILYGNNLNLKKWVIDVDALIVDVIKNYKDGEPINENKLSDTDLKKEEQKIDDFLQKQNRKTREEIEEIYDEFYKKNPSLE